MPLVLAGLGEGRSETVHIMCNWSEDIAERIEERLTERVEERSIRNERRILALV